MQGFPESLTVAAPSSFNLSPVAASSEPGGCRTENKVEKGLGWCQRGVGFAFLGPHNPCRMETYASSSLAATPSSQSRAAGPAGTGDRPGAEPGSPSACPPPAAFIEAALNYSCCSHICFPYKAVNSRGLDVTYLSSARLSVALAGCVSPLP